jgi:hypothetical protein
MAIQMSFDEFYKWCESKAAMFEAGPQLVASPAKLKPCPLRHRRKSDNLRI